MTFDVADFLRTKVPFQFRSYSNGMNENRGLCGRTSARTIRLWLDGIRTKH